ncbi:DNA mismatch repair endonuclease MutL [Synechococcus sp. OH2]|uniref:DNA mismatch repair endonuclease MutL n=1 Tax=Synechococcus sp. OH2 TaxID=136798 RepID=UPI0039C34C26
MSKIQPLNPERIAQMAAGEVIDSLEAALRELLENALDAQATRIQVEIWPSRWQVRVADNGQGIPGSELEQVARRHTTSKLDGRSLGFRGEALHSLARLGSLTIQTRHAADAHGWLAAYDRQGELTHRQPAAMALGTVVTVADLFADWPLRRRSLPQTRPLLTLVQNAALAHPWVSWQVRQEGQLLLSLWPGQSLQDLLLQVLPQVDPSDLRYRRIREGDSDWEMVLGLPDRRHRPRPDWIRVAVNGRFVQMPEWQRLIQSVFQHALPRHRYPLVVVHLRLPPEQVDWNRHPAKSELYLQDPEIRQEQLRQHLHALLQSGSGQASRRSVHLIRASEAKSVYEASRQPHLPFNPAPAAPACSAPSLPSLRALAQLHRIYILAEHPQGLWLVEQHLAHERVRYEYIQRHWQPVELETPVMLEGLSPQAVEQLEQLGLEPEPFGPNTYLVRRLPLALWSEDPKEIQGSLLELSRCADLESAQVAVACRGALRNGIPLTLEQMQQLLEAWQRTANPHTCPHGRPVYLALAEKDLARYFRRRWGICDRPISNSKMGSIWELEPLGDRFAAQVRRSAGSSASDPTDEANAAPL